MDDYLSKPISPKALIDKVERWAAQSFRQNRNAG
jgi:CheY-like chemotaxis protein